jgi:hypothetical protein
MLKLKKVQYNYTFLFINLRVLLVRSLIYINVMLISVQALYNISYRRHQN